MPAKRALAVVGLLMVRHEVGFGFSALAVQ